MSTANKKRPDRARERGGRRSAGTPVAKAGKAPAPGRTASHIPGMITSVKEPPASSKVIPPLGPGSAKVSISLPRQLLAFADQLAEETSKSRSEVVAGLLRKEEEARIEALMIEGYRAMAEENLREAEESMHAASEVILRDG